MLNINMEHYEFINKTWTQNAPRNKTLRLILVLLGSVLLIITFIQIIMDGLKEINWFLGIILPFLLIVQSFMFTRNGRYVSSLIIIETKPEEAVFKYPNINRLDKMGIHSEIITIKRSAVEQFQYSKELNSIRIISRPSVKIETESRENLLEHNSSLYELVLYPPANEMENILSSFEKCFGRSIVHMDQ